MSENTEIDEIRSALREIRVEGLKASLIHAVIDSTVVLMAVALGLTLVDVRILPSDIAVPLPEAASSALNTATLQLSGSVVVAVAVTAVFFAIDVGLTYRRRTVEAFESLNPEVRTALRTARDVSEDGEDNTMARALYSDVLERLKETSSGGFVSGKRILFSLAFVLALSLLLVYATTMGFTFGGGDGLFGGLGGGGGEGAGQTGGSQSQQYTGLQSGEGVLGDEQDVSSGSQDLGVSLGESSGSGSSGGGTRGGYGSGDLPSGSSAVESQRAGYSSEEQIEDSELVKEYNLRIRGG